MISIFSFQTQFREASDTVKPLVRMAEKLKSLAEDFSRLNGALGSSRVLHIFDLQNLPESFSRHQSPQNSTINCCEVPRLPDKIGKLCPREELSIYRTILEKIKQSRGSLRYLESLPEVFGELTALQGLNSDADELTKFPASISPIQSLQELTGSCSKIAMPHDNLRNLNSPKHLAIHSTSLESLAKALASGKSVRILVVVFRKIPSLQNNGFDCHVPEEAPANCPVVGHCSNDVLSTEVPADFTHPSNVRTHHSCSSSSSSDEEWIGRWQMEKLYF